MNAELLSTGLGVVPEVPKLNVGVSFFASIVSLDDEDVSVDVAAAAAGLGTPKEKVGAEVGFDAGVAPKLNVAPPDDEIVLDEVAATEIDPAEEAEAGIPNENLLLAPLKLNPAFALMDVPCEPGFACSHAAHFIRFDSFRVKHASHSHLLALC